MNTARKTYDEVRIDSWDKLVEALGSLPASWIFRGIVMRVGLESNAGSSLQLNRHSSHTLDRPRRHPGSLLDPYALVKYVLSTSKLGSIAMRKLYSMNVTYYTLFPGLDGLARSMD
jgi:hypothetical protein